MMYYLEEFYAPALPSFCTDYINYVTIRNNDNSKKEIENFDPENVITPIAMSTVSTSHKQAINYKNIYRYYYHFSYDSFKAKVIYFKRNGKYYRAFKIKFTNFQEVRKIKGKKVHSDVYSYWGNEGIFLEAEENPDHTLTSTVYFIDREMTKQQFKRELKNHKPLCLKLVFDEIIADG